MNNKHTSSIVCVPKKNKNVLKKYVKIERVKI